MSDTSVPVPRRGGPRPSTVVALSMLGVIALLVVVLPLTPVYDPFGQDLANSRLAPFADHAHLLGTDNLGRDMLSRLSLAGRTSVLVVAIALALNIVVGVTLGLIAGYFGRWVETVVMSVADLQLSFPLMILLVSVVAVIGPSFWTIVIVLGLTYWMGYGRVTRAIALSMRKREFVLASVTHGASAFWTIRKHLLPQIVGPVTIMGSFDLGVLVVLESSLSYLGLGIQPPTPSLGGLIADGQHYLQSEPWAALLPGFVLFLLVAGVQILSQRFTAELNDVRSVTGERAPTG